MKVAGCYRVVRHKDRVMPSVIPRPILGREYKIDVRIWSWSAGLEPMLLVNASKKFGRAVRRNHFRRQVRMAFLSVLQGRSLMNTSYVVWVRPARSKIKDVVYSFQEIEDQIRLALNRWEV